MSITESYFGYIETTRDALLVFEACKRGIIPRITRRLQEKDRHLIKSGSIFCFDERESGIKRWTDGLIWSPSRILGNFLVYRELQDKKMVRSNSTDVVFDSPRAISMIRNNSTSLDMNDHEYTPSFGGETGNRRQREKYLIGSLKSSYKFKRNGLVKKSMSLVVDGVQQHLISYYNKDDVLANRLLTPSSMAEFSSLRVSTGLKLRQNFKAPFLTDEGSDDGYNEIASSYHKVPRRKYTGQVFSMYNQESLSPLLSSSSSSSPTSVYSSNSVMTPEQTAHQQFLSFHQLPPMTAKMRESSTYPFDVTRISDTTQSSINPQPVFSNTLNLPLSLCNNDTQASLFHKNELNKQGTMFHSFHHNNNMTLPSSISGNNRKDLISQDQSNTNIPKRIATGGGACGYAESMTTREDYTQQNPHQHLFSSNSFHTFNHASHRTDTAHDSYMFDINLLLGTGWNDFEIQM